MAAEFDNGILAQVSGDIIGSAHQSLPPPATATEERMTVDVNGGHLGPVRITYERKFLGRHKAKYWAWVATRADAIEPATAARQYPPPSG